MGCGWLGWDGEERERVIQEEREYRVFKFEGLL